MRDLLAVFARVTKAGKGWIAQCPAHEDNRNSLSIAHGDDGRWLLKCHAGCSIDTILAAASLTIADLFPDATKARPGDVLAQYDYRDADGALLYQVQRFAPKSFRPRRPNGAGGWIPNLHETPRVLYRLPEIQGLKTVYVVEGERDADRLWRVKIPATTNFGGAGKWIPAYTEQLRAAGVQQVVVLPDNDPPGANHGRTVARACVDARLDVKLIALPDLSVKGDVSNYLDRHPVEDLVALVKDAPLFDPARRVAEPLSWALTSLADFLAEPEETIPWIVEERIPAGAVVLFCGAPKAGKSTAVRELAAAVARGEPWLGWTTKRGPVWLLAFEDQKLQVRRHLRQLGATGHDALELWIDRAPADLLRQLEPLALTARPSLIILDTLVRVLRGIDINDYAAVSAACEPWLALARRTGATLIAVHHASVHHTREGLDAILGSTALAGSADNVFLLKRLEGRRVLSSIQRIGPDLEPTVLVLNRETGHLSCAGTKRILDDQDLRDRIVETMTSVEDPVTEDWVRRNVEGRGMEISRALRILLSQARVARVGGHGKRGDPYLYRPADSRSQTPGLGSRNGNGEGPERETARKRSMNPGLEWDAPQESPMDPRRDRETSQKTSMNPDPFDVKPFLDPESSVLYVREGSAVREGMNDSDPDGEEPPEKQGADEPIPVPEGPKTTQTDPPESAKKQHEHWSDSRSHNPRDDDERF